MYKKQLGQFAIYQWDFFEPWQHRFTAALTTRHEGSVHPSDMGFPCTSWAMGKQVHGTRIVAQSSAETPPYEECDAIILDRPGQASGVFLADCHPIIVYDPVRHIGGIAHAGWRGTLAGIPILLVEQMKASGSHPNNLIAVAGPGIGPCCYTVGKDVAHRFMREFGDGEAFLAYDESCKLWRLDIERINLINLKKVGIPARNIGRGGFCTVCTVDDFYSYRRDTGITGRQAAIMILHPINA